MPAAGEMEAARRPHQQLDTKHLFQRLDLLAHLGARQVQLPCGRRDLDRAHRFDEGPHAFDPVQGHLRRLRQAWSLRAILAQAAPCVPRSVIDHRQVLMHGRADAMHPSGARLAAGRRTGSVIIGNALIRSALVGACLLAAVARAWACATTPAARPRSRSTTCPSLPTRRRPPARWSRCWRWTPSAAVRARTAQNASSTRRAPCAQRRA